MPDRGEHPNTTGGGFETWFWIASGLVVLAALLYRIYAVTGDIRYDPAVYAQYAYNISKGSFQLNTDCFYAHRLPVFAPVALAYAVFGVETSSTYLWPVFVSILQIGIVWWLGKKWLGWKAAILGTLLLAIMPLDVNYAAVLGPDVVLAGFVTLSVATWIAALETEARGGKMLLFLSGIFLALATITRLYAVSMVFFFAVYALQRRSVIKTLRWWLAGSAVVGVSVLILYIVVAGDPALPLKAVLGFYSSPERSEGMRLLFYPGLILKIRSETGLFALVIAAAAVVALIRHDRKRLLLLGWMAPLLIFLQFGSMSLDSYVPIFKRARFLTPFCAPGAMLAALVLLEDLPAILGKFRFLKNVKATTYCAIGCLILALGINSMRIVGSYRSGGMEVGSQFRSAVETLRSDKRIPVLFDHWRTAIRFAYYFDFEEGSHLFEGADESARMNRERAEKGSRLGYLKWYSDPAVIPDSFIVLEDRILDQARQSVIADPSRSGYPAKDIPSYCDSPPNSWRLIGRYGSVRIFRTG